MLWTPDELMGRTAALRMGRRGAGGFLAGTPPTEPAPPTPPTPGATVGFGSAATGGGASPTHNINSATSDAFDKLRTAILTPNSSAPEVYIKVIGNNYIDGGGLVLTGVRNKTTFDGSEWTKSTKSLGIRWKGSDLIVRHWRQRPGDQVNAPADTDGFTLNPGKGGSMRLIVFDHVSLSWGPDVTFAVLNTVEDGTFQYCLFGPGLYKSTHPESPHSYGVNVSVPGNNPNSASEHARRLTFYRDFYVHNWGRNLKYEHSEQIDVINPVVYNAGKEVINGNARSLNLVGGMFKKGPKSTFGDACYKPDPNYPQFNQSVYLPTTGTDRNIGLGFTPTYNIAAAARRTTYNGGGLTNATVEEPDGTLAATIVAEAGHGITDAVDQQFKDDFTNGTGDWWYGQGFGGSEPYWP